MKKLKDMSSFELEKVRKRVLWIIRISAFLVLTRAILVLADLLETNRNHTIFLIIVLVVIIFSGVVHYRCHELIRSRVHADLAKHAGFDLWLKNEVSEVNLLTPEERDFYYRRWLKIIQNDNG